MKSTLRLFVPAILSTVCACASGGLKRIDDAELANAPAADRAEIDRRAGDLDEAQRAVKAAERDLDEANFELRAASYDLEQVKAKLSANERLRSRARQLELQDQLRDYEGGRNSLERIAEAARCRADLAKARRAYAQEHLALRKAELQLADTEYEEAKALALKDSDRLAQTKLQLSDFKTQVATAHAAVAREREDTAQMWKKVEMARERHEKALKDLPATSDEARQLKLVERDKARLNTRIRQLEEQIRALERENARLMVRVTSTATTASR